jgi:hypothetical protein
MVALETAAARRTVRYRPNGPGLRFLRWAMASVMAIGICITVACGYSLATKPAAHSAWVWILAVLASAGFIAQPSWYLARSWRPVLVITGGCLRVWQFAPIRLPYGNGLFSRDATQIPLGDVTGVGLVFRRLGTTGDSGSGWYLMIWHGSERGERVPIRYTPMLRTRHDVRGPRKFLAATPATPRGAVRPPFNLVDFDPAAETDPAKLAATYAGRAARDVLQHVLAQQGPSGLLAVIEEQKHVLVAEDLGTANVEAYWSPDGAIGACRAEEM